MSQSRQPNSLASVRAGYDRWAEVYDHDANPLPALEEPHVQCAAGDIAGLDVLDLGCGTGRHTAWLAARGAKVTAIDFSEGMLAQARRKTEGADVRFIVHDLHRPLPFSSETFDLIVSGLVLEHLSDLSGFFSEAYRVLRTDGRAIVSAMHPAMFLRGSQARFTDPASGHVVHVGSIDHRMSDIVMAAVRSGFTVDDMSEHAPDAAFAFRYPRAEKYIDWPMLIILIGRRRLL